MWIQSPRTGGCFSFRHCWLECQKRVFKVSACWRCRRAVLYYRHIAEWKYVLKLLPAALAWRKLPELAVATPHGVQPRHRSQFRRTAPAKPRCGGQETYGRTNSPPWRRQQDGEVLYNFFWIIQTHISTWITAVFENQTKAVTFASTSDSTCSFPFVLIIKIICYE